MAAARPTTWGGLDRFATSSSMVSRRCGVKTRLWAWCGGEGQGLKQPCQCSVRSSICLTCASVIALQGPWQSPHNGQDVIYYISLYNENHPNPPVLALGRAPTGNFPGSRRDVVHRSFSSCPCYPCTESAAADARHGAHNLTRTHIGRMCLPQYSIPCATSTFAPDSQCCYEEPRATRL